ncbi:MAG: heliorhodopsin HeR [Actinomycetes bacterium]
MTETPTTAIQLGGIRRYNLIAGLAHLAQAIVILVLANDFSLPVQASFMTGPPGTVGRDVVTLFSLPVAWLVAVFFLMSAIAHFVVTGPAWGRYSHDLLEQRNPFRWLEYSLSSSLMIILIAELVGIDDIAALIALIGVNASMIGFGWLQERFESPGGGWWPFVLGCGAGIIPWVAIGVYLAGPGSSSSPPGFVYGIFFSLFVFFNLFALTQWLQYKKVGRWADYLVGERSYITLSLVAKSLLAWQIFASTLASASAGS